MFILNQDKDEIFTLSDKGLFKGHLHIEVRYWMGNLMGYNIIGKRMFCKNVLLGTYEEGEAQYMVHEIYRYLKQGVKHYSLPDPALDLEDLQI